MKLVKQPPEPAEVTWMRRGPGVPGWGKSKRKLATVGACRQEAARIYHAAANGDIAPEDLSRAIYALDKIAALVERADLEARLDALEARLKEGGSR